MIQKRQPSEDVDFFNVSMAKWVIGVLGMLIAVVREDTLLGLILRQTRSEIAGLVRDEESVENAAYGKWFLNN